MGLLVCAVISGVCPSPFHGVSRNTALVGEGVGLFCGIFGRLVPFAIPGGAGLCGSVCDNLSNWALCGFACGSFD